MGLHSCTRYLGLASRWVWVSGLHVGLYVYVYDLTKFGTHSDLWGLIN